MRDILLVYPGKKGGTPRLPLSLLYIGSALKEKGFKPYVWDMRTDDSPKVDFNGLIFAGISSMTGSQIMYGLDAAKLIREKNPNLQLVWGGIHPTLHPKQTLEHPDVDIVVIGEGEVTAVELAERLSSSKPIDEVRGIAFSHEEKTKINPPREFIDLDTLSPPAYDLVDIGKYPHICDSFSYQSSRGCPHPCGFCYNMNFNRLTWRSRSPHLVLEDLKTIKHSYDADKVSIIDDNFFVDKKRVEEVCDSVIEENMDLQWSTSCRVDYFSNYKNSLIKKISKSNCWRLAFGAESGSQRILNLIQKGITPQQIYNTAVKCVNEGIEPLFSFVVGFPEEREADLEDTIGLYDRIKGISSKVNMNGVFLFTPYPGTSLYSLAIQNGFVPPNSLEAWGKWEFNYKSSVPWLSEEYKKKIEIVSYIARYNFFVQELRERDFGSPTVTLAAKMFNNLFGIPARLRWGKRFFRFPIEWKIWAYTAKSYLGDL